MKINRKKIISFSFYILLALSVTIITGLSFNATRKKEAVFVVREGIVETEKLSKYNLGLKNTCGDADIFIIDSGKPGPSLLVLGGTHGNEPAGQVAATLFLENAVVENGKIFVLTETNKCGYTSSYPQEGAPVTYNISTEFGSREFIYGSRATNFVEQWPVPDVYVHQSGSKMSGGETRNINRAYPGIKEGNITSRIAYAVTELVKQNDITLTVDLHEAAPEYPVNNALVYHEKNADMIGEIVFNLEMKGVIIKPESSPKNFRGLTHRELGDFTNTRVFLAETSNASQGRIRGAMTEELIVTGKDRFYEIASKLGITYVDYDENGVHLNERVARHVETIMTIVDVYNNITYGYSWRDEGVGLIINNMPSYDEINTNGIGTYLLKPSK